MVPQIGEKRAGGGLSGIAAMAGIDLSSLSGGDILSPNSYPQILNNINFQKELIYSKFNTDKSTEPISYFDYVLNKKNKRFDLLSFIKKYTIGLPSIIIQSIRKNDTSSEKVSDVNSEIPLISFKEDKVIKDLMKNLSLNINTKEGYFTFSFTSPEPKLSAEVVKTSQALLQKYITEFKLQKVRNNLDFIENSYNIAKKNFEEKQQELAKFRDSNVSLYSAFAKTQEEKLTSEYNLLLNIYTDLAKQKEQAKISVTETTPILTIIKPVIIPTEKSGPKRLYTLVGLALLGFIFGAGSILFSPYIKEIIKHIN